jgi:hypothetical protein
MCTTWISFLRPVTFISYQLGDKSNNYLGSHLEAFIALDPDYLHGLLRGNYLHPTPPDNLVDVNDVEPWAAWIKTVPAQFRANPQPIIQIEVESYDSVPRWSTDPAPLQVLVPFGMATAPFGLNKCTTPGGCLRNPMYGDHVSIEGLLVSDTGHSWYVGSPADSYCYKRGVYTACHAHMELHPLKSTVMKLIPRTPNSMATTFAPDPAPGSTASEAHTIAAPVYGQFYPNGGGPQGWQGGQLVDDSIITHVTADYFLWPPPQPANGCAGGCKLIVVPAGERRRRGRASAVFHDAGTDLCRVGDGQEHRTDDVDGQRSLQPLFAKRDLGTTRAALRSRREDRARPDQDVYLERDRSPESRRLSFLVATAAEVGNQHLAVRDLQ